MMEAQVEGNSERNRPQLPVSLPAEAVRQLRAALHGLANVFTGVLMTGGLLQGHPAADKQSEYADDVCTLGERGAALVRELRSVLMRHAEEGGVPGEWESGSSEGENHV